MPLRPDSKKKLNNSDSKDEDRPKNSSFDSCYDTMDEANTQELNNMTEKKDDEGSGDEEDVDSDKFLSELGLETEVIKRINNTQVR